MTDSRYANLYEGMTWNGHAWTREDPETGELLEAKGGLWHRLQTWQRTIVLGVVVAAGAAAFAWDGQVWPF
jgi:hypothetical protein